MGIKKFHVSHSKPKKEKKKKKERDQNQNQLQVVFESQNKTYGKNVKSSWKKKSVLIRRFKASQFSNNEGLPMWSLPALS